MSKEKIEPCQEYIDGVNQMRPPTTKKGLQSLIGTLVWLRTFIGCKMGGRVGLESFSHLMNPIMTCNNDKKFAWTDAATAAFEKVKKKLSERPFISFYQPNKPIVLTTDASDVAAGAVLQHRDGQNF